MEHGTVVGLYISAKPQADVVRERSHIVHGQPLASASQVHAVPGHGLEGDRYFLESWPRLGSDDRGSLVRKELTLIEAETLDDVNRELGLQLPYVTFRRQIVTQGISLNELVDEELTVGEVVIRGVKLDEGCMHLEEVAGAPGLFRAIARRGGLRAQILTEGIIRVGDPVRPRVSVSASPV